MLGNYLKIAWRNLRKHKVYSAINICGLALGLACCMLIALFVRHELSYDRQYKNAERVYRIAVRGQVGGEALDMAMSSAALAPSIKEELPAVAEVARLWKSVKLIHVGEQHFFEQRFFWADSGLFEVFGFPLIAGDAETALSKPNTVVLTEATARRYFGEEQALGKMVSIDDNWQMEVVGVAADLPDNVHFKFDILASSVIDPRRSQEPRADVEQPFLFHLLAFAGGCKSR